MLDAMQTQEHITAPVHLEKHDGKFTIRCAACKEIVLEGLSSESQAMHSMPAALEHYAEKHPTEAARSSQTSLPKMYRHQPT